MYCLKGQKLDLIKIRKINLLIYLNINISINFIITNKFDFINIRKVITKFIYL